MLYFKEKTYFTYKMLIKKYTLYRKTHITFEKYLYLIKKKKKKKT